MHRACLLPLSVCSFTSAGGEELCKELVHTESLSQGMEEGFRLPALTVTCACKEGRVWSLV